MRSHLSQVGMKAAGAPPVRLAYAAAHVVRRAEAKSEQRVLDQIDWDRTLHFRKHLWGLGFGVAEAMDTAQRNVLGWDAAAHLMDLTLAEARRHRKLSEWAEVMGGAGTDGLTGDPTIPQIIDEYLRQGRFIQERGGTVILLATPFLPRLYPDPAQYEEVYNRVAEQLEGPIYLHWLGEMFAPNLAGYFPGDSFTRIMQANVGRIAGVKISLLNEDYEVKLRRWLRTLGQVVLTGDDYNYPGLILGDGSAGGEPFIHAGGRDFPTGDFSHALLGVFDAIAPVASAALTALAEGNVAEYRELMEATQPLGRLLFEPPTANYKAGVIFLAYLNGHQDHFSGLADIHLARDEEHYRAVYQLAAACGALRDAADARQRMEAYFASRA